MSYSSDLLEQASRLARQEPRRPRQASLRRAVSATYYALFHLLLEASTKRMIRGRLPTELDVKVRRAFDHATLKKTALVVSKESNTTLSGLSSPSANLRRFADTLVTLQIARHSADYDLGTPVTRKSALDLLDEARLAYKAWGHVSTEEQRTFLLHLLLGDRLKR